MDHVKTHGHEREKRKREETSSSQAKKIRWRKDKGKRDRQKRKGKKKKTKRKSKEGKEEKNEGECMIRDRGEKKGTTLPFEIYGEPTIETRWGKRQSWFTRRELCVGTRNCGFRRVPKGRGFSYTSYFLPSGHVRPFWFSSNLRAVFIDDQGRNPVFRD